MNVSTRVHKNCHNSACDQYFFHETCTTVLSTVCLGSLYVWEALALNYFLASVQLLINLSRRLIAV